jgi:hypothetical protein
MAQWKGRGEGEVGQIHQSLHRELHKGCHNAVVMSIIAVCPCVVYGFKDQILETWDALHEWL